MRRRSAPPPAPALPPAALLAAALLAPGCGAPGSGETPAFVNHGPEATYVGLDECRQCHLEIAASYARTGMARAFYRMTPDVAVEDFEKDNEIEIRGTGLRYRMIQRDGKFYMRQFRVDSRGNELAADERELVWVIGSNNHSRSYITLLDGKMFQAPVCWYPEETLWDLCPGFEHDNSYFSRGISDSCVFCHNGRMELVPGTRHEFREPFPHGIDCERCHGPGSLHVERWSSGSDTPTGGLDPTIVNPRRLPLSRRIQVCFQCHLGDSKATHRVGRHDRALNDFRPGQHLTEVLVPFHYREPHEHDFGLSAQADRLILSRCYTASEGQIECLTCHNPHVTVYREDRPADFFRRKCLTCHAGADCTAPADARQATTPLADDCVACHMRTAPPDDQLYTTFTDHWIRRDIATRPGEPRHSLDIEPALPEQFAGLSESDRAFYRARAQLLISLRTPDRRRRQMWEAAVRDFERAIAEGFDGAAAHFFLGQALGYLGRDDEAARAWRSALERDPGHYDAAFALGQHLAERGAAAQARRVFREALDRHPGDAGALAELGRLSILEGRVEEGVELYSQAIAGAPWHASLFLNRGMGFAALGGFEQAAADAREAARLDPGDPGVWEFSARVLRELGRDAEAAESERVLGRLARGAP